MSQPIHSDCNTRRNILAWISAGVFCAPLSPAFAGEGGQDIATKPSKPPVTKQKYNQTEFTRLSKREIDHIWSYSHGGGFTPKIFGFSNYLDGYIFAMATVQRRRTQSLVREMGKLKGRKARQKRLKQEVDRAEKEIRDLQNSLQQAKNKKRKNAIKETESRLISARFFLDAIKRWHDNPMDGTN